MRKVIGWAVVILLAYYLITAPTAAGHAVHNLFIGLKSAAHSVAMFLGSL